MNPSVKGALIGIIVAALLIGMAMCCNSCATNDRRARALERIDRDVDKIMYGVRKEHKP